MTFQPKYAFARNSTTSSSPRPPKKRSISTNEIVSIHQDADTGVPDRELEGLSFTGDVLVGADAAYSNARQLFYEQLKIQGLLPVSYQETMAVSHRDNRGSYSGFDYGLYCQGSFRG
jgi:2-polyprenyl-6-methoxyphenol hydroxylase-like FAD-dependent oxidoreductase